jgi:hypothetical protein
MEFNKKQHDFEMTCKLIKVSPFMFKSKDYKDKLIEREVLGVTHRQQICYEQELFEEQQQMTIPHSDAYSEQQAEYQRQEVIKICDRILGIDTIRK